MKLSMFRVLLAISFFGDHLLGALPYNLGLAARGAMLAVHRQGKAFQNQPSPDAATGHVAPNAA